MSFTAPLFIIFISAGAIYIDGYELEKEDCVPQDHRNVRVQLTDGENIELEFAPQDVTINVDGDFTALTTEGKAVACLATVSKPISEADLIKSRNYHE